MVKELDDAPREDVAVVLDQDPDGVAGARRSVELRRGRSRRGRARARPSCCGAPRRDRGHGPPTHPRPCALDGGHDWEVALDVLAAVEPVAGARDRPGAADAGHAARAGTRARRRDGAARPGRRGAARAPTRRPHGLARRRRVRDLRRAPAQRREHGRPARAARGIPVAVVSAGVPLEVALAGRPPSAASHDVEKHRCETPHTAITWSGVSRTIIPVERCGTPHECARHEARLREQPMASAGRRLLAAALPVAAIAFAWASLEVDASDGRLRRDRRGRAPHRGAGANARPGSSSPWPRSSASRSSLPARPWTRPDGSSTAG